MTQKLCECESPYLGAHPVGEPDRCERCGGLVSLAPLFRGKVTSRTIAYLVWYEDKTDIKTMQIPYRDRYKLFGDAVQAMDQAKKWGYEDPFGMGFNLRPGVLNVYSAGPKSVYFMCLDVEE